jgi:hypothetical protein
MSNFITRFFESVEDRLARGNWFRRGYVVAATYLSWETIRWSMHFAEVSTRPGSDIALIIGAITASVTAIQGFAFKQYMETKVEPKLETPQ